ncbi:MAG: glycoside hydrolase family 127 protein [Candidatus Aegiribacteria sp.]|nr:glycoside hydrolase family 127 protein [Candidatus Aegiribacteria sp.]
MKSGSIAPVPFRMVSVDDRFWTPRMETNRLVTIPLGYEKCRETGRLDAWKLDWKEGDPCRPHIFWDSDVAKWMEAAACTLHLHPDTELKENLEGVITLMEKAQQPDGYLNSYFTMLEPENRWTNLRDRHELYCAGHLIEAAVMHFSATGDDRFLNIVKRYADCIDSVFGNGEGQKRGYPGHEELELALVKLFDVTGENRYLQLADFFLNQRGTRPHYYDLESKYRSEDPAEDYEYWQAHLPVREQKEAVGHAVRAMYLYSGMADVAARTDDNELAKTCRTLWRNVTGKRMYITGGVGSTERGESFTADYDLPNETAYAETCAAIGLVFWAHRMLHIDEKPNAEYADVMERSLYNCVLSGVSLDGTRFFYTNPLEVRPGHALAQSGLENNYRFSRQEWFNCSCCPTNIMRVLSSFGLYVYASGSDSIYIHLYVGGTAEIEISGVRVKIRQETDYPWKETVTMAVEPEEPIEISLFLRIPGWCENASVELNGKEIKQLQVINGYAEISRLWRKEDTLNLTLPMPVRKIEAHPEVRGNCGKIAITRGPIVYCLEEEDNTPDLNDIRLDSLAEFKAEYDETLLGGCTVITGTARIRNIDGWVDQLYRPSVTETMPVEIKAIPYCLWNNRRQGGMIVWISENIPNS